MAITFTGSPVTFGFTAASNSTARTIQSAQAIIFGCSMFDDTSDTIAVTIAGAAPTESFQGGFCYLAVFVGAPSGSQTVAVSGGDAGDDWSCGFDGIDGIDEADPFDGAVSDTASPGDIDVVTTADGMAVGMHDASSATTTTDTERWEGPLTDSVLTHCASAPGTGGTVQLNWSPTDFGCLAVNMRAEAAPVGRRWILGRH